MIADEARMPQGRRHDRTGTRLAPPRPKNPRNNEHREGTMTEHHARNRNRTPGATRNTGPARKPEPLTLDARIRQALGHAEPAPARTGDRWPTHRAHRARRRGRNGKTR